MLKKNCFLDINEENGVLIISMLGEIDHHSAVRVRAEIDEKILKCKDITPATLSMKPFVYDALLTRGDKHKQFIIDDIKRVYKKMLDCGATSFWETELGWEDFSFAGSLCHGWSASPAHYLVLLGCNKDKS